MPTTRKILLIPISVLLLGADAQQEIAKEMKALEGTWQIVAGEASGSKMPEEQLKNSIIVIADNKFIMTERGKEKDAKELVFKVDPAKKPKRLDLTNPKDKDAKSALCIYSLDGDELKLCMPLTLTGSARRPTSFDTTDKSLLVFTCKREKK
jgi:uncharacterized protein (TIGR03067 family)